MKADWGEIEKLFFDALAHEPAARTQWVIESAGSRAELAREVLTLLEAHEASEARPPLGQVGAYRLAKRIGRGGMGEVWLAARADGQFEQKVAVKLVHSGLGSDQLVTRFQRERQLLARLSHPNIVRLIDGGVSTDGRPFLVMEYIEGEPLLLYADRQGLSVRQRVELFRQLCGAIAYAHRNLIVHRDLKPSNVLVDAAGAARLLDFGIARLLEAGDSPTASALPLLTPRYASPEQVRGEPAATSSDIYSLGVLLFELLTGQLPYQLRGSAPAELIGAITTQTARLASRVSERAISADLDAILAKVLEKDPARRYASAEALSDDLANWLAGLPVAAHLRTRGYLARKYLRRHWAGVSAAAAVMLVLVAATVISLRTARVADRQRERADRITNFVVDVLTAANPANRESGMETTGDAKLVDVMQAAAQRLAAQFADDPGIQSELHAAIGRTEIGLGNYAAADAEIAAALKNVRALEGQPAQQARVLDDAARLNHDEGRWEAAVQLERQAVDLFSRSPEARGNPAELSIMVNDLGVQLADSRRPAEAAAAFSRALGLAKIPPRHDDEIGAIQGNLGDIYVQLGRLGEAERAAREAVEVLSRLRNPGLNLGYAEMKLARIEYWRGHADAALADVEKATADATRFAGPDHPFVVTIRIERDYQRAIAGHAAEAEADLEKCLAAARKSEGGISVDRALAALGYVRALAGHAAKGEPLLREALSRAERNNFALPMARTEAELAECLARAGKTDEARAYFARAHAGLEKIFGPGEWITRESARRLAEISAAGNH